jgi:hypothetical protein
MRGLFFGLLTALTLSACGGAVTARRGPDQESRPHPVADAREICLVAGQGAWQLDLHFGDPARDPAHLYFWVVGRPGRLGLDADPTALLLPPPLIFGSAPPPPAISSQWLTAAPIIEQ